MIDRLEHRQEVIEALTDAQKIAFAPLSFQAVAALLELGILKLIDDPKDPITDAKVELGKKLYFDPRMSKSSIISCNTCHNLATGGTDGISAAIGHGWQCWRKSPVQPKCRKLWVEEFA